MLKGRAVNIVLVSKAHGTGIEITDRFDKVVKYEGKEIKAKL